MRHSELSDVPVIEMVDRSTVLESMSGLSLVVLHQEAEASSYSIAFTDGRSGNGTVDVFAAL